MDRRKFIKLSGLGLAGASAMTQVNAAIAADNNTNMYSSPDVIVVGAGAFGVWTAYHLSKKGLKVTLLDAYGPGNSRSSSGGETRQIQTDRSNPAYIRSAIYAYAWWEHIGEISGVPLVIQTGKLAMYKEENRRAGAEALDERLQGYNINNTEILSQEELRERWPQMYTDDIAFGVYHDGGPSGSTVMARRGCAVVASEFVKNKGELRIGHCQPMFGSNGKVDGIKLQDGKVLKAQSYVFACGPWLPKLFPELLGDRLKVERRDVLHYGLPAGDSRYAYPNLPNWKVVDSGFYGFPDIEHHGFKVAPSPDYNTINPDTDDRLVMPHQVKRARDHIGERFPGLAGMPITETRVCQVTNSVDGNFIIDHHPDDENTWIVGGGTGHGFKHAPNIGRFASQRVLGKRGDRLYRETFALKPETFSGSKAHSN